MGSSFRALTHRTAYLRDHQPKLRYTSIEGGKGNEFNTHRIDGLTCQEMRVPLSTEGEQMFEVTILEALEEAQEILITRALEEINEKSFNSDPYGAVVWPAARTVSRHMIQLLNNHYNPSNTTILELGAGTGLVSLTCAIMGCKKVISTDYSPFTLQLIERAKTLQKRRQVGEEGKDRDAPFITCDSIETRLLDVSDHSQRLPECDICVIADLLYSPYLGEQVAKRVYEALSRGSKVVIGDSPNRPGRPKFLECLNAMLENKWISEGKEKEKFVPVDFEWREGRAVSGYRHSLISTSHKHSGDDKFSVLPIGLLHL